MKNKSIKFNFRWSSILFKNQQLEAPNLLMHIALLDIFSNKNKLQWKRIRFNKQEKETFLMKKLKKIKMILDFFWPPRFTATYFLRKTNIEAIVSFHRVNLRFKPFRAVQNSTKLDDCTTYMSYIYTNIRNGKKGNKKVRRDFPRAMVVVQPTNLIRQGIFVELFQMKPLYKI